MTHTETPIWRVLDDATRAALVDQVETAKARGWLQPDLKRWFKAQGIELATYLDAKIGQTVPPEAAALFAQLSITGLPARPYAPNREDIRRHLDWLAEPARGAYDDALIEIAYDGEGRGPSQARLFGLDEMADAATFAAERNEEGCNVYLGAALRDPETPRNKRSTGDDFYVATAVPIDIDHDYDATRARMATVCDDGLVVTTGMTPERRSQHWARLVEPCDDDLAFEHAFGALVAHTGADMKVKDKARIMRLGGTVSYPKDQKKLAAGYCTELTSVSINTVARLTEISTLTALSPFEGSGERFDTSTRPQGSGVEREGILQTGRVVNGRESFFRDLLLRHLADYQRENGADPSPEELWNLAWADFFDPTKVDNEDGRWTSQEGVRELRNRLHNTFRRLRAGRLSRFGLFSIETGQGREEAEAVSANRAETRHTRAEEQAEAAQEQAKDEARAGALTATPYKWVDATKIPPRDLLYGKHFFRKFLSVTVSPGGLGKSSNAIVESLAMVTGRTLIGEAPKGELRVWYWNGEDPEEELQRRIAAACLHFKIDEPDLGGRLFVDSGRDKEIILAREDRNGFQIAVPVVDALIQTIKANGIDVLVIDPFVASHAVSENDNTKIEGVVRQWMRVAEDAGCAVELIHHVRKPSGGASQETTVDDARGAGALLAKARSARVLNGMSVTEADEVGIDRKERWAFFRIDNGKANLMPRGGDARWRRMVGVPLGNRLASQEDNVGVTTEWSKPSAFEGVTEHQMHLVRAAIEDGEWRDDVRASNWAGVAVAGALALDLDDPSAKARIKSMLKTWVLNGVLDVVQGLDQARRKRQFIVVGKDIE
jgi:hypothetical protein